MQQRWTDSAVRGDYLYIVDNHWVKIFDFSDNTNLQLVGEINTHKWIARIDCAGEWMFITQRGSLHIYSLTDPANPELLSTLVFPFKSCNDLNLEGNYVYMVCDYTAVIIDIANPGEPQLVGRIDGDENIYRLEAAGNFLFLHTGGFLIQVVDVTNPASPLIVKEINDS